MPALNLSDRVGGIESRVGRSPWVDHEYVRGYSVTVLPFSAGDLLGLRVWPQSDFGPYASVWHRSPDGEWSMYSDGLSLETTCSRYWNPAIQRNAYRFYAGMLEKIDELIETEGIDAPDPEFVPRDPESISVESVRELDLAAANVQTVLWATGFRFDFDWVEPATFDEYGYPVHDRGVTDTPGLYSLRLPWLHTGGSSLLFGIGGDAEYVTDHILAPRAGHPKHMTSTSWPYPIRSAETKRTLDCWGSWSGKEVSLTVSWRAG